MRGLSLFSWWRFLSCEHLVLSLVHLVEHWLPQDNLRLLEQFFVSLVDLVILEKFLHGRCNSSWTRCTIFLPSPVELVTICLEFLRRRHLLVGGFPHLGRRSEFFVRVQVVMHFLFCNFSLFYILCRFPSLSSARWHHVLLEVVYISIRANTGWGQLRHLLLGCEGVWALLVLSLVDDVVDWVCLGFLRNWVASREIRRVHFLLVFLWRNITSTLWSIRPARWWFR